MGDKFLFHLGIRLCDRRMRPQIIAKKEGIALIGASLKPHMYGNRLCWVRRTEKPLRPFGYICTMPRRKMVLRDMFEAFVPCSLDRCLYCRSEALNSDLNVDAILGGQTGNRCRTDMVYPERKLAQSLTQASAIRRKLCAPGGPVGHYVIMKPTPPLQGLRIAIVEPGSTSPNPRCYRAVNLSHPYFSLSTRSCWWGSRHKDVQRLAYACEHDDSTDTSVFSVEFVIPARIGVSRDGKAGGQD